MNIDAVLAAQKKTNTRLLRLYGRDVRRESRRMMKRPKRRADGIIDRSLPGSPPLNQTGVLRGLIAWGLSGDGQSVSIGPLRFKGKSQGAHSLEYGGVTTMKVFADSVNGG